ncbi:MAG: exodeoxyribonuclease VII large subunit [Paludibacteraceae bacterium]|nr:exodeoxyribonuclease VII large subunit [Paludibacteraceae bacterium]
MTTYSLSQLSELIGEVLSVELNDTYWVRAEIASLSRRNGHGYFDLVEKGKDGLFTAKMRGNCWANVFAILSAYFEQETGSTLQAGIQVLLEVEINWHDVYGLSLNIVGIDPQYTIGDLARQRQETIRQLQKEGILDMQQSLTLPTVVRRIAVISSDTAAGYEDFIHQLSSLNSTLSTTLHSTLAQRASTLHSTLFPAIMQGDSAEASILKALQAIAQREDEFDVVVIIRGGGASLDMSCFDSYLLAATCAQFPLPIITGIGHTRDVSVIDLVAYRALKTPTAVAAFFVDRLNEEIKRLEDLRRRLLQTQERQVLIRKHAIELLAQRLASCDPARIYKMGYSLTTINGQVLTSKHQVQPGQTLITHLRDGEITSLTQ